MTYIYNQRTLIPFQKKKKASDPHLTKIDGYIAKFTCILMAMAKPNQSVRSTVETQILFLFTFGKYFH